MKYLYAKWGGATNLGCLNVIYYIVNDFWPLRPWKVQGKTIWKSYSEIITSELLLVKMFDF